jgi:hypothetical protein
MVSKAEPLDRFDDGPPVRQVSRPEIATELREPVLEFEPRFAAFSPELGTLFDLFAPTKLREESQVAATAIRRNSLSVHTFRSEANRRTANDDDAHEPFSPVELFRDIETRTHRESSVVIFGAHDLYIVVLRTNFDDRENRSELRS